MLKSGGIVLFLSFSLSSMCARSLIHSRKTMDIVTKRMEIENWELSRQNEMQTGV